MTLYRQAERMQKYTIREPVDLVVLVPHVLGFRPAESVVVVALGPTAGFHSRIDLPTTDRERRHVAQLLLEVLVEQETTVAALVVYTEHVELAEKIQQELQAALTHAGIELLIQLRVHNERFFQLAHADPMGTVYDFKSHPFSAARVFAGHRIYESREAYAATLAPTSTPEQAALAAVIEQLEDDARAGGGLEPATPQWQVHATWLQECLARWEEQSRPLGLADMARLIWLLQYGAMRELAWVQLTRSQASRLLPLWCDAVRRAPEPWLAEVAAVTAFVAWLSGDGALAWCALDRISSLEGTKPLTLVKIVKHLLSRAVSPDAWSPMSMATPPSIAAKRLTGELGSQAS